MGQVQQFSLTGVGTAMMIQIHLDSIQVTYTRKVYSLFDAFGDFGGIKEVLILFFGFFLSPLNQSLMSIDLLKTKYKVDVLRPNKSNSKSFDIKSENSYSILCMNQLGSICKSRSSKPKLIRDIIQE